MRPPSLCAGRGGAPASKNQEHIRCCGSLAQCCSCALGALRPSPLTCRRPHEHLETPGSFRLSVIARLLTCKFWKSEPERARQLITAGIRHQGIDLDDIDAPVRELVHAGRPRADAGEIEHGGPRSSY
jgi:hypothetical protein